MPRSVAEQRFWSLLGLCRKAKKLFPGDFAVRQGVALRQVHLILLAEDAGRSTARAMGHLARENNIPYYAFGSREALGRATGFDPKAVLGIADQNLANELNRWLRVLAGRPESGLFSGVDE